MAKPVNAFKTQDGRLFETEIGALAHEKILPLTRSLSRCDYIADPAEVAKWIITNWKTVLPHLLAMREGLVAIQNRSTEYDRLIRALKLCDEAASGHSNVIKKWGNLRDREEKMSSGTSLGARVNTVGEIVCAALGGDEML